MNLEDYIIKEQNYLQIQNHKELKKIFKKKFKKNLKYYIL
jgi:hypothetical protein